MFAVFRAVAERVRGFHAAVGALLFAAVALIMIGGFGFALLADEVMEGGTQQVDDAILLWMNRHASPALTGFALDFTALGSWVVVWMVTIVASVFLWSSRHRWSVALLWISILGADALSMALKAAFDRPRPHLFAWRVPYAGLSSFPSGHSLTAMVAYSTLAYLSARLAPTRFQRRFIIVFAAILIACVGLSRMYVGVHYPTDVLGGFALGLAWAVFCALGLEAVRYFRHREPEVGAQERDLDASVTD
jgi:undecaprenyl-diphosphatase